MVFKMHHCALYLVFAGMMSLSSGAAVDTITGVVSDTFARILVDSVIVSAEGATALTNLQGVFTISFQSSNVQFAPPRRMPFLSWHPENGSFSWDGYNGDVSITVHSLQGNIVASAVSGKNLNGPTFSLARLPQGIFLVAIETQGLKSVYKISSLTTRRQRTFSLLPLNPVSKSSAAATASAHVLTFTKKNYDTLKLTVPAGTQGSLKVAIKSPFPLLNVLHLFTDPSIPDPGPDESPTTPRGGTIPSTVPDRIGGLDRHPFLFIGESYRRICLMVGGKLVWHYDTENDWEDDDIWMLSNGNILHAHMRYIEELTPKKEVVWRLDAPTGSEIHCCQPIGLDKVMYFQSQSPNGILKLFNLVTKTYEMEKEISQEGGGAHGEGRRIRLTGRGTYVATNMGAGVVYELDSTFKTLWSFSASCWSAVGLKNGNVIAQEQGKSLCRELKEGKVVWSVAASELTIPGGGTFGNTQTCERLSNGNTVLLSDAGCCGIQAVEVTPEKQVVWVLQDWRDLGDGTSAQFLDEPGYPEIPGQTNH